MKGDLKKTNAAILFSDIVGYTALMGEDQDLAFELINKNLKTHQSILEKHKGKLIKELGDGILCSFPDSQDAVAAAYELQKHYFRTKELSLRIGIHYGEVILDRNDVFGDAVNIASRLQTLGLPGSVLFSKKIQEGIKESTAFIVVSKGVFKLKNVKGPIEIFALANEGLKIPKRGEMLKLLESRLRKFMAGAVILLTLVLTGFWIYHNSYVKQLLPDKEKSIAVLPFKNLDIEEENDYFVSGLTFDIISQLSKISDLRVISKSSSDTFKNSSEPLSSIAKNLGVNYLLESSIQKKGEVIRIRTDLVDVSKNQNIWGETFEFGTNEVYELQQEISIKIAMALSAQLSDVELSQLQNKPTENISAYEYYLKGREHYYRYGLPNTQLAINEFKKALELDPEYAMAWAGLGDAYSLKHFHTKSDWIWLDSAIYASETAIRLDSNLSEGYKALSTAYNYQGKFDVTLNLLKKALEKNPNNPQAIGNYATTHFSLGNLDESLVWQKRAAGLNPRLYIPFQLIGWAYRLLGDYDEALLWLNKSLEKSKVRETYEQIGLTYLAKNNIDSAFIQIPRMFQLIDTLAAKNVEEKILMFEDASKIFESAGIILFFGRELDKAKEYFKKSVHLHPAISSDIWAYSPIYLGYLLKLENNMIDSETLLEGSLHLNIGEVKKQTQDTEHYFNIACIYATKDENEKSLQYLRLAKDKKWADVIRLTNNPIFEHLQSHPEFQKIVQEINRDIVMMRQRYISLN